MSSEEPGYSGEKLWLFRAPKESRIRATIFLVVMRLVEHVCRIVQVLISRRFNLKVQSKDCSRLWKCLFSLVFFFLTKISNSFLLISLKKHFWGEC